MGRLSVALLGPPEVRLGELALGFRTRKTLALLCYLAAEGGTHPRAKLAELLWPASDERRGRTVLRSALADLRRALGGSFDGPAGAHLLVEGERLGLRFGPEAEFDLRVLEGGVALARRPPAGTGVARRDLVEGLEAALAVRRGGFMEGFSLDDAPEFDLWLAAEREAWRRRAGAVFERLFVLRFEGGEAFEAAETAARWVARDPSNGTAVRRLVEARLAAGDAGGALGAYEEYRPVLIRDLGPDAAPEPALEALADRARAASEDIPVAGFAGRPPRTPFVGRAEEFATLVGEYRATARGEARVVALVGEAGIGKTRLAEEFSAWAKAEGADTLRGGGFEGGGLPYGPLIDALRERIEEERSPDDLLDDVWLSELSRLLPELKERYSDLPPPASDEATAKARLFESVSRLVEALAEGAPVVLFVDDLQWADAATLEVLRYAARGWAAGGAPVLLIAGLREESLATMPELEGWLRSLGREMPPVLLTLGPLSGEDTARMMRVLAEGRGGGAGVEPGAGNGHAPERLGRLLHEETGGQPLFLAQTIRSLLERGALESRPRAGGAWAIVPTASFDEPGLRGLLPPGVREVIRGRLAGLNSNAKTVLAAGAVLGHGFGFETLARVAGVGEDEGLSALDELLGVRLLRETGTGQRALRDAYSFVHDKIRDVVYTEIGDARRRVFHRRALEALEEDGAPPAELSRHAFAAAMRGPAFRYGLAAGDAAMEVLAARDAIAHYGRALRLLEERADGRALRATLSARELRRLYVNLARAHELDDEWERARATYREMLESEREPELRWTALNRLAILSVQRFHDVEGATALLEEALRVAAESDDRNMLAGTEWNLAQVAGFGYEPDAALAHGEKALGLARDLGLPELTARALYTLAFAHGLAGRWEEAAAHAEEARQSYAKMGNRTTDARALSAQYVWAGSPPSRALYVRAMGALCLSALSVAKVNLGEPRAGVDLGRAALDIGAGIGNAWVRWVSAGDLSYGLVELGRYGEALRVAREGVELARKLPNPTVPFFAFTMLGNAYQATLGLEDARVAYLEALSRTDAAPVRPHKTMVLSKLCANRALAGDQDGAYAYAQESVAARRETPTLLVRFDLARHHETEALLRGGSEGLAREDLREFGERVGANRRFRVPYLRMLAVLARWDGEPGEAIRHLREARALAEEIGLPGELWQIEAELGELHERNGRRAEARSAFSRAAEIVRKLAGNLEDGAPRAGFFGTPQVQGVLER